MAKRPNEHNILMTAWLLSEGHNDTEIRQILEVERTTVYRRIERAKELGWLEQPDPPPPKLTSNVPEDVLKDVKDNLSCRPLRLQLEKQLKQLHCRTERLIPRKITVERAANRKTRQLFWNQRLEAIGKIAAGRLVELQPQIHKMGILWGKTMRYMVDALRARPPVRKGRKHKVDRVVPLCGQPLFVRGPHPDLSASTLAADLAQFLNGAAHDSLDLAVPASIPERFEQHKDRLREFFSLVPAYQTIFGTGADKPGLVAELDTIVTSAGSVDAESSDPLTEARLMGEDRCRWPKMVAGDVGGVLFARRISNPNEQYQVDQKVKEINERWLGARITDFQRCAEEAVKSGGSRPGVVVVAVGKSKAVVLFSAIREGCINELLIDDDLGEELERLLTAELDKLNEARAAR